MVKSLHKIFSVWILFLAFSQAAAGSHRLSSFHHRLNATEKKRVFSRVKGLIPKSISSQGDHNRLIGLVGEEVAFHALSHHFSSSRYQIFSGIEYSFTQDNKTKYGEIDFLAISDHRLYAFEVKCWRDKLLGLKKANWQKDRFLKAARANNIVWGERFRRRLPEDLREYDIEFIILMPQTTLPGITSLPYTHREIAELAEEALQNYQIRSN